MRTRNKHKKSTASCCNPGSQCSLPVLVWSLVGCILTVHLYSLVYHKDNEEIQVRLNHLPLTRELEEVEEENFQIPPPRGKRSPHAEKRRGKRAPSIIDEFLDDSSPMRHMFFPNKRTAIDPMKVAGNDTMYFYPARQWLDTDGNPIQAHGGGLLYVESSETYYWYGENKDGETYNAHINGPARKAIESGLPAKDAKIMCVKYSELEKSWGEIDHTRHLYVFALEFSDIRPDPDFWNKWHEFEVQHGNEDIFREMLRIKRCVSATYSQVDIIGVSCYSSKDLWTWKNEGIVLPGEDSDLTHDLHISNVLERPKVIYNDKTGLYVMWMHIDNVNYTTASVGVAISESPIGRFKYLYSKRPHGYDSRDMTVFKDEDGRAYLFYSSEDNSELHVGPLTDDYLDVTKVMRRVLVGEHREAPAVFKHHGTYYMITWGAPGGPLTKHWLMLLSQ